VPPEGCQPLRGLPAQTPFGAVKTPPQKKQHWLLTAQTAFDKDALCLVKRLPAQRAR